MDKKLLARFIVRETMGVVLMAVVLFWSAGTLDWWPAWALVGVTLLWVIATLAVILRFNPDLLAERLGPKRGGKVWDTAIMSVVGLLSLARLVIAGFDQRHSWTGAFPSSAQIAALIVCALGYALAVWATASNAFFSQIVRIQDERGHAVVSSGPYQYVRHPAYIGTILNEIAAAILLGSWWALIPSVINAILLVVRTVLEDRALLSELDGYQEYAKQVRYRLLPGVW